MEHTPWRVSIMSLSQQRCLTLNRHKKSIPSEKRYWNLRPLDPMNFFMVMKRAEHSVPSICCALSAVTNPESWGPCGQRLPGGNAVHMSLSKINLRKFGKLARCLRFSPIEISFLMPLTELDCTSALESAISRIRQDACARNLICLLLVSGDYFRWCKRCKLRSRRSPSFRWTAHELPDSKSCMSIELTKVCFRTWWTRISPCHAIDPPPAHLESVFQSQWRLACRFVAVSL